MVIDEVVIVEMLRVVRLTGRFAYGSGTFIKTVIIRLTTPTVSLILARCQSDASNIYMDITV